MIHETVSVEKLQTAICIWEECMRFYQTNMRNIRSNRRLTWWLMPNYWANERAFHKSFQALIKRRIQLQTAIKEKRERENNG